MEHNAPATDRLPRIPPIAWFLAIGLLIALVAIVVFRVPLGTVGYFAFFAFFMGSHFFMHSGHGGHGQDTETNVDGPAGATQSKPDDHTSHSGGCH
jgi:fatty acid desaturase